MFYTSIGYRMLWEVQVESHYVNFHCNSLKLFLEM